MTVIAWRNGVMACDSRWSTFGFQTVSAIKIQRLSSGALLGSAGDNDCRAMVELLDKIKDPRKLPSRAELEKTKLEYEGLIAFPRGGVWYVGTGRTNEAGYADVDSIDDDSPDCGVWNATTMGGYAAIGSGGEAALCAMDAGASAREAVEIACRRISSCSGPVHVRRLVEDTKPTKGKK